MQNAHQISRHMHQMHTSTDTTTRVVTFSPRHVALYHLKHFAKVSIVAAATIVALLYTAVLVIGVPTVNM
ncbi:MAG: hypothetical protein ACK5GU_09070 [Chloroflexota bacterium]|jgi:hypothetical protein